MNRLMIVLAATLLAVSSVVSPATIIKGPFDFADEAFVDDLLGGGGDLGAQPSGGDIETFITDTNLATAVALRSTDAFMDLAFTDNFAVNGVGTTL